MKRVFFVLALTLALVLSFSAIAGAKYAGYALDGRGTPGNPSDFPGFLTWQGAINNAANAAGNVGTFTAGGGAHGGYAIASSKCYVCHSAHRAGEGRVALTMGGSECTVCHTTWGGGGSGKKVEWNQSTAGPHKSDGGCIMCHKGGIHGGNASEFPGMNVYLLGAGSDSLIKEEIGTNATTTQNTTLFPNGLRTPAAANWFFGNANAAATQWDPPSGLGAAPFAMAKGTATGMSCNQSGCHTNSVFAVNHWEANAITRNKAGDDLSDTSDQIVHSGHMNPGAYRATGTAAGATCGPCHGGNVSGGFRSRATGRELSAAVTVSTPTNSRAYGCDQCHDMVGVATGTTAFPHGNNVLVYEWNNTGEILTTTVGTGNLWMYAANLATIGTWKEGVKTDRTASSSEDTPGISNINTPEGARLNNVFPSNIVDPGGLNAFPNRAFNASFRVIQNAVQQSNGTFGIAKDGACLKCHITTDDASFKALVGRAPITENGFKEVLVPDVVATSGVAGVGLANPTPAPGRESHVQFSNAAFWFDPANGAGGGPTQRSSWFNRAEPSTSSNVGRNDSPVLWIVR